MKGIELSNIEIGKIYRCGLSNRNVLVYGKPIPGGVEKCGLTWNVSENRYERVILRDYILFALNNIPPHPENKDT